MNKVKIIFGFEQDLTGNRIRAEVYGPALNDILRAATDRFHGATLTVTSGMVLKGEHYVKEQAAIMEAYSDLSLDDAKEAAREMAQGIAQGLRQSKVLVSVEAASAEFIQNSMVQTRKR